MVFFLKVLLASGRCASISLLADSSIGELKALAQVALEKRFLRLDTSVVVVVVADMFLCTLHMALVLHNSDRGPTQFLTLSEA